jgi:F-type H+-transporting ATPase subunit b
MRDLRPALRVLSSLVVLALLLASPVFAQEGGDAPANSAAGATFRWVNFAIVFIGLVYVIVKWGAPAFRKHAEEISQKIAEGTRAREAAEAQRAEIRAKLEGLEAEVQKMRVDAKREAEAEAQRLRSLSKVEAQKIEDNAQAEIAAAVRAAQLALKSLTARNAIAQAESLLRKDINAAADSNLVRTFVKDLEGSVN